METEVCKTINVLIRRISMSLPESIQNGKLLKDLIYYAGQSEDSLKYTHKSLLRHLRRKNSSIRLGVFLIMDAFFRKSSFYRDLFLDDFQGILERTIEHFCPSKMPPPRSDVKKLKEIVREKFDKWHKKFSKTHPRVEIAYNYLKTAYKDGPPVTSNGNLAGPSRLSIENENFIQRAKEKERERCLNRVKDEVKEHGNEISDITNQMQNCFELIISKPDEFMGEEGKEGNSVTSLRDHGLTPHTSITIDLSQFSQPVIQQTEDNNAVIETLKGLYVRGKKRFLPKTETWITTVKKYDDMDLLASVQSLRDKLLGELMKYEEINILPMGDSEEYDSSDFEDVPDAEPYSESAAILSKVETILKEKSKPSSSRT